MFKKIYFFALLFAAISCTQTDKLKEFATIDKLPSIFPDYTDILLPINIAPVNFQISDTAIEYRVEISSEKGEPIIVQQKSPEIKIDIKNWHKLLSKNAGKDLNIDIFIKKDKWYKYRTIKNHISEDKIDKFLVYRLINGAYIFWEKMGIYQRCLEDFNQYAVFENKSAGDACVNCHMFANHDPHKMQLHFRGNNGGTVIYSDKKLKKINTKVAKNIGPCAYPSWHPNGKLIAYSVNVIRQNFTSDHSKTQDVFDKMSDIVLYNIETNTLKKIPQLSTKNRENLPTWSPDGKTMYYISAPEFIDSVENNTFCQYSLVSIPFDENKLEFGTPDTLIKSSEIGLSITFPVVSPEGNYLLFGTTNSGYFPVYHTMSDIYIYDILKKTYSKADFNSNSTDSYHSWSSNGRWIVFSSKRMDDTYSRPQLVHFSADGKTSKAFVLPQEDPSFYRTFIKNFNRPELITDKIDLDAIDMRNIVLTEAEPVNVE